MKIYDCFNFFNELDILELRLNILYEHVDYFVIVESSVTHSGKPKGFYFEENKNRFSKFLDKIINYKIYDTPNEFWSLPPTDDEGINKVYEYINSQTNRFNVHTQPDYGRDFYQKESVRRAIMNCDDEDIVMFSDADEIPNPELISKFNELDLDNNRYSLNQMTYYYYLNVLKQSDWYGTKVSKYKNVKNISLNELRGDMNLSVRIPNGGWHWSFCGGKEMVKTKITSYSAREYASEMVLSNIESNMANNIDPFFRGHLQPVSIDNTFPEYLRNNIEKYKHLIKW